MKEIVQRPEGAISLAKLGNPEFARIATIAQAFAGLDIPDSKKTMVQSRLSRRLKATGFTDFRTYLDHVESNDGSSEREQFISSLTTNVSHFFREEHHFTKLKEAILPDLLAGARGGRRVRIWSAGCSTGQEAYTIAITLLELDSEASSFDIRILATDIDPHVLAAAKKGHYDAHQIRPIPEGLRKKHFEVNGQYDSVLFTPGRHVKDLVCFRHLNLMGTWPMRAAFDIIFCRNVVIYFSEDTQLTLWPRFRQALTPKGWLFLGHSERIHYPLRHGFEVAGVTTYRRT